jgi:hypothetical protein
MIEAVSTVGMGHGVAAMSRNVPRSVPVKLHMCGTLDGYSIEKRL